MEIEEQSGNFGVAFEFRDLSQSFWVRFLRVSNPSSSGYAVYVRRVQSQSTAVYNRIMKISCVSRCFCLGHVDGRDCAALKSRTVSSLINLLVRTNLLPFNNNLDPPVSRSPLSCYNVHHIRWWRKIRAIVEYAFSDEP